MGNTIFRAADILLPDVAEMEKWPVIACDQFTSDKDYWERVEKAAEGAPSTLNLILPEADLGTEKEAGKTEKVHKTMKEYLENGVFREYQDSFVYVERTMEDGSIRKGIVGMVDLTAYDYEAGSVSPVRATEKTVTERIPPRKRVRKGALLELPHVLMLCDDKDCLLVEAVAGKKESFPKLYDFDLMEGGGHIIGRLVSGEDARALLEALEDFEASCDGKYADLSGASVVYAVGDGNHSLATAKACFEELKEEHPDEDMGNHPSRYALVELENIHDEALKFEPIHRAVFETDPAALVEALKKEACAEGGFPVTVITKEGEETVTLDRTKHELPVGVLQEFLDGYLKDHAGRIDYIHDDEALRTFSAKDGAVGFLLPAMEKESLFRGVVAKGVLPRKTFSMGHSREKRYYLEARKILP